MRKFALVTLALVPLAAPGLAAQLSYKLPEETATFRPGPGIGAAQDHCATCHSADYVSSQPAKQGQAFWEAEVQKMIKVYGAPIDQADVKAIVDYLAKTY
jgi:hypothetical protein